MNQASDMMTMAGVRIPDFVQAVLLILSGFLGFLIDQRLSRWIVPIRLLAGLSAMFVFGAVVTSIILTIMVARYDFASSWSHIGVTMFIASGTGEIAAGGAFVILIIRFVMPVLALAARMWDRVAPHLQVKSPD
ncbi:hypothetical protein [Gemmobacter sp.]|uniref:hypothetical protein n=1 Tax=Gemmobacter sp. TaxID=1898957 RepID=UPI002AFF267F|nr:hypothetical protein [Gemmobacter sp.]